MTVYDCERCGKPHPNGCHGHAKHSSDARAALRHPDGLTPCRKPPMKGSTVCNIHGGEAPQVRAKGAQMAAEDGARKLAARWAIPIETTPTEAILGRVSAFAGHVAFYAQKVAELDDDQLVWGRTREKSGGEDYGTTEEAKPNAWLALYNDASAQLVKFAAEALRAGVEERRVRIAEQVGQQVAAAMRAVANRLNLTPAQAAEFAIAAPEELRRLYAA